MKSLFVLDLKRPLDCCFPLFSSSVSRRILGRLPCLNLCNEGYLSSIIQKVVSSLFSKVLILEPEAIGSIVFFLVKEDELRLHACALLSSSVVGLLVTKNAEYRILCEHLRSCLGGLLGR